MLSKLSLSPWLANDFLQYLKEWVEESKHGPGTPKENERACLKQGDDPRIENHWYVVNL